MYHSSLNALSSNTIYWIFINNKTLLQKLLVDFTTSDQLFQPIDGLCCDQNPGSEDPILADIHACSHYKIPFSL